MSGFFVGADHRSDRQPLTHNKLKLPDRRYLRLENYDYSTPGAYFVTYVAQDRRCIFGDILDGIMVLSEAGAAAQCVLLDQPQFFSNLGIDCHAVMPNHIHVVFWFAPPGVSRQSQPDDAITLPQLMKDLKAFTTRAINSLLNSAGTQRLQRGYYEHIVRDEDDLARIREYIITNPLRWHLDVENPHRAGKDELDLWNTAAKAANDRHQEFSASREIGPAERSDLWSAPTERKA